MPEDIEVMTRMIRSGQQDRVILAAKLGSEAAQILVEQYALQSKVDGIRLDEFDKDNVDHKTWFSVALEQVLTGDEKKELLKKLSRKFIIFHMLTEQQTFWYNLIAVNTDLWRDTAIEVLTRRN